MFESTPKIYHRGKIQIGPGIELSWRMPQVYAYSVRLFRILPPPLQCMTVAPTFFHPSMPLFRWYARGTRSLRSSSTSSYDYLHRYEVPGNVLRTVLRNRTAVAAVATYFAPCISVRSYNSCKRPIVDQTKMACPVRDPASEQLNDYKRKLKVL